MPVGMKKLIVASLMLAVASPAMAGGWLDIYGKPPPQPLPPKDMAIWKQCQQEGHQVYLQASAMFPPGSYIPDLRAIGFARDCLISRFGH